MLPQLIKHYKSIPPYRNNNTKYDGPGNVTNMFEVQRSKHLLKIPQDSFNKNK